jgi:glycosyltransferase involved in cell wall biosynthesis
VSLFPFCSAEDKHTQFGARKNPDTRTRLAILSTHPIQYHAPLFRGLAAHPDLSIHVYFCHKATPKDQARAGFKVAFEWDVPLLEGYPYTFLRNVANQPGHRSFAGFDTPEIGAIIRGGKYDAVLVNGWNYKSAWQAIWAAWQSDVRVFVRGDSHLRAPRSLPVRLAKLLLHRRFVPRFDACLAAGEWSREYFAYYGARQDRIFLVPHVIDFDFMVSESRRFQTMRSELRQQWGLREDGVVFIFVGKFTDIKRPLDFVRAVQDALKQEPSVQALMVGDGPLRETCENFVRSHHVPVSFTGFLNQSHITRAYVAGDVLVLPSIGETWGVVVNEAMACGRPCLVSDRVGCGPDLVIARKTGLVFPHGNVAALATAMVELARDPSQIVAMGENAHNRLRNYSVGVAVEGVLESLAATIGPVGKLCPP